MSWKLFGDQPLATLKNRLAELPAPKQVLEEYNRKLQTWIDNVWLLPYHEDELGSAKGLITLIAVVQKNKQKVRTVMDFRKLNKHVDTYPASANVCTQKLSGNSKS